MSRIFEELTASELSALNEKLTSGYGKSCDYSGMIGATDSHHSVLELRFECRMSAGSVTDELTYRAARWDEIVRRNAESYRSYL